MPDDFPESRRARLDALLCDYEQGREDERVFSHLQGVAIALALTAVGLLGALKFKTSDSGPVYEIAIAGAPLLVLSILALIQTAGSFSVLRSFYLRSLEEEIREAGGLTDRFRSYPAMPLFSMTDLVVAHSGVRPGTERGPASGFRAMIFIIFVSLWVVFGGLVVALAFDVSPPLQLAMAAVYGVGALALMVPSVVINLWGREVYEEYSEVVAARVRRGLRPEAPIPKQGRGLISYLLVPRPDDLLAKSIYFVLGAVSAMVVTGHALTRSEVGVLAVVWMGTEYLNYQARYQWNDLRGRHEDGAAPTAEERGRLPEGIWPVKISWAVLGIRLYLYAILVVGFWTCVDSNTHPVRSLLTSLATVWGLAIVYEAIKFQFARGHSPLGLVCLHLVCVGLGYPARFMVGWVFVSTDVTYEGFGLALIALWALGIGFCAMTWILEAASYGSVVASTAGPALALDPPRIATKPHLGVLARWAGVRLVGTIVPFDKSGSEARVFQEFVTLRLNVWDVAYAAVFLVALLGAGPLTGLELRTSWIAALVLAAVALWPSWRPGSLLRWPMAAAVGISMEAVLNRSLLLHDGFAMWPQLLLVGGWISLPAVTAAMFLNQSYANTRRVVKRFFVAVARSVVAFANLVDGNPARK